MTETQLDARYLGNLEAEASSHQKAADQLSEQINRLEHQRQAHQETAEHAAALIAHIKAKGNQ